MKLQPGTEVTPNVRLEHLHAQGAMGSVWVAKHVTLGTKVAVKFISDRLDTDHPEVLQRFVREAASAAQIKSSHVVQTFDQGVMSDGTPYIVMEFLEGEELRVRLERERRLAPAAAVSIVTQTAKALSSAHKVGIIHRDIKPGNIFLSTHDDELHVKVFDFGIAKRRSVTQDSAPLSVRPPGRHGEVSLGLTNDGVMIGTPEYMSPEAVMSASSVDHHADLWSLAVVAYVCLTGELPFRGRDVGELCVNLLESQFTPPSQLRPELGPEVDAFFATALAKNIAERFRSARALAQGFAGLFPSPSLPGEAARPDAAAAAPASLPEMTASQQGLRAATFSGSSADLGMPARRRLGSVVVVGAVAAGILAVGGVWVVASAGSGETAAEQEVAASSRPAARALASAPVEAADSAAAPEPEASASAATEAASAEPAASVPGAGTFPRKPAKVPWVKPRPKDPGF